MFKLDEFIIPNSEAFHLIKSCDRTKKESYDDAWKLLCKTYDNKRRQVDGIIRNFMEMPRIRANRDSYLRACNHINHLITTLPREGVDVTTWDPILVYILENKLEYIPRDMWRQKRAPRDVARLQPFVDFLQEEIEKSDATAPSNDRNPSRDQSRERRSDHNRSHSRENRSNRNHSRDRRSNQGGSTQNERRNNNQSSQQSSGASNSGRRDQSDASRIKSKIVKPKKCPVCPNAEHSVYVCPPFNRLDLKGRTNKANEKKLCHNCLRPKCSADKCTLGPCPNGCGVKHNRLLCPKSFAPSVNVAQQSDGGQA